MQNIDMCCMKQPNSEQRLLSASFTPSRDDVLCGRDQESIIHEGNIRLRKLIREILPKYEQAPTKKAKTRVVADVVDSIRNERHGEGGFVRKDLASGRWFEIGNRKAREKVGHIIRIELKRMRSKDAGVVQSQQKIPSSSSNNSSINSTAAAGCIFPSSPLSAGPVIQENQHEDGRNTGKNFASLPARTTHEEQKIYHIPRGLSPPSNLMATTSGFQDYQPILPVSSASQQHPELKKLNIRPLPLPDHVTVRESQECQHFSLDDGKTPNTNLSSGSDGVRQHEHM